MIEITKEPEIKYVKYGVANRFKDEIELHEELLNPKYKELHDFAVTHERKHTSHKASLNDMLLDYFGDRPLIVTRQYWNFLLNVPSSRIQLSPIYPAHGRFYFDVNLMALYIIVITISWMLFTILL